jgi:hypothetical protein
MSIHGLTKRDDANATRQFLQASVVASLWRSPWCSPHGAKQNAGLWQRGPLALFLTLLRHLTTGSDVVSVVVTGEKRTSVHLTENDVIDPSRQVFS